MANKYLKFEYWNTCDLGNVYYMGGQHFWFFLDADVLEPFHEETEDGQENGDGDFIPTFRRGMKRYKIRTGLVPEYLIDAMQRMKLHDNIELTFKSGEIEQIFNIDVEPEWQFEKYRWQATVALTFDMDEKIVVGACCDNLTIGGVVPPEPIPDLYWVAQMGSDLSGDGTYNNPWATLAYAVTQATTVGDVIHVKAGTITETAQIVVPVGVSIVGAGDTTIITSAVALEPLITMSSVAGNAVNGNQSISYLQIDGNLAVRRAIYANYRSNVEIHHCTFVDMLYSGVTMLGTVSNWNVTPTNTIPTGNSIHDCVFTNCTQFSGNTASGHIRPEGQRGMLIYNNTFNQTGRVSGQNADVMAGYQNYGLQIYNNTWTKNDTETAAYNFFFELHYNHGGGDIYGNTFNGAATLDISGVEKGTYFYGMRVYNNDFLVAAPAPVDANYSPCITLESFDVEDYIYIYQNYFKNVRGGIYLDNVFTSADNIWIYYNIFENVGNATDNFGFGIMIQSYWGATNAGVPFSNIYILNNVIDCGTEGFDGIGAYIDGTISNLNIQNNIINGNWEDYAIDFKLGGGAVAATVNTLNLTNNIFNGTGGDSFHHAAAITINTEDSAGNIDADPLFVGATDFHLQVGSPAINAGTPVGLTVDYAGDPIGVVPEIGAYKY